MKMNKPVKYQEFKLWPADLQREYLENLVKEFDTSINSVAKMMGSVFSSFHSFLTSHHLRDVFPKSAKMNHDQIINWNLFCKGEWVPQNTPESHENALRAMNSVEEDTDIKEEFVAVKSHIGAEKTVIDSLNEQVRNQFGVSSETADTIHNAVRSVGDSLDAFCSKMFKAEEHSDSVKPEQETYPMTFTLFSFDMRDVKSWDDVFEMLRKFPLPEKNILSVTMNERHFSPQKDF